MFPLPLIVQVGDSPALRALLIGLHLLAVTAVWLAKLPWGLQVGMVLLLLASLMRYSKPRTSLTLRCHHEGKLERQTEDGWITIKLDGAVIRLPGLILLRYGWESKLKTGFLLVAVDGLADEDWRRLKVLFRLQEETAGSNGASVNGL